MNKKMMFVMLAIIAVGVFMLPDLLATFAGSHTIEKSDPAISGPTGPGNVDLECNVCHGYIQNEMDASNSSIETEKEHKQVAYLSVWTTYSTLGDDKVPTLISFVDTSSTKYPIWSNPTTGPKDKNGYNVSWVFLGDPEFDSTGTQIGRDAVNGYSNVYYAVNSTDNNYNLTAGTGGPYHGSKLTYNIKVGQQRVKFADVYNSTLGRVTNESWNATNVAAWNWTNQSIQTSGYDKPTSPTVFLGSRNVIDTWANGTAKSSTATLTMVSDNNAQCYVCHRAGIFNVTGSHTKVTVRGCTDAQCHGADTSKTWTGNVSLKNTSSAYRSKFGEFFSVGNCGAAGCHVGEFTYKRQPANEIGAKIGDASDAHNRWFTGLKSSNSTYKDENGNAINADYYTCLGCHTHVGMKLTVLRPAAFDISISKQNVTITNYVYDRAPTLTINNTANATNTSIKPFGTVWQR